MSITIHRPEGPDGTMVPASRMTQGFACGMYLMVDTDEGTPRPTINWAKVGNEYLALPNQLSDIARLPICNRCDNVLACAARESMSVHQENLT